MFKQFTVKYKKINVQKYVTMIYKQIQIQHDKNSIVTITTTCKIQVYLQECEVYTL